MVAISNELNLDVAKCVIKLRFHHKAHCIAAVHNIRILQLIQSQTE